MIPRQQQGGDPAGSSVPGDREGPKNWTEAERETARLMRAKGASFRSIGQAIGRTASGVEYQLNIRRKSPPPLEIPLAAADRGLRHPVDRAVAALNGRARVTQAGAVLDGRPASLVQVVEAANAVLASHGMAAIAYPGVPQVKPGASWGGHR